MKELLAKAQYKTHALKKGQEITGVVTAASTAGIYLDIGGKTEGLVLEKDKKILQDLLLSLKVGDKVSSVVLNPESDDGYAVLSLRRQRRHKAWQVILDAQKKEEPIDVLVTDTTRNGLLVEHSSIRGFIPISHLLASEKSVGETLKVKVLEADPAESRLILSEKAVSTKSSEIKKNLSKIKINQTYEGTITGITNFGLFVTIDKVDPDLIGVEGLVHISEISWEKVDDLDKKFQIGQTVQVVAINVDLKNLKLNLSIKHLLPDPWMDLSRKFSVDQQIAGEVTKILKVGIQVAIDGLEGLIHQSKIPPGLELKVGQKINCVIESIDAKKKRISLIPVLKEKPIGYR